MTKKSTTQVFKFLLPVMPSVEKTVNLHRFKKVYKPKNNSEECSRHGISSIQGQRTAQERERVLPEQVSVDVRVKVDCNLGTA